MTPRPATYPYTARSRSKPVSEWPQIDREMWARACQPGDFWEEEVGRALKWKVSTRNLIELDYGHWLGWLHRHSLLEAGSNPGRTNIELIRAYRDALVEAGFSSYTVSGRIKRVGDAVSSMMPRHDWVWLRRAGHRLHASATPTRDRSACMRPPEVILQLGLDLMAAAEKDRFRTDSDRALLCRDGLMLAFLILVPIRNGNFSALKLDQHIKHRNGEIWLVLDKDETKTKKRFEVRVPEQIHAGLMVYLEKYRGILIGCSKKELPPTSHVWISQHGTNMTQCAVSLQIKSRTKAEFGASINPHTFRTIAATAIATYTPHYTHDVRDALGHSNIRTSEIYYNKANSLAALESLERTIIDTLGQSVPELVG